MSDSSARLQYIADRYGQAFHRAATAAEPGRVGNRSVKELVDYVASYDPSRNKSATQWLIQTYLRGGVLLEDLAKARDTLEAFGRLRRSLPPEERDLGRYRTLANLWKAVKPFVVDATPVPVSGKVERRRERAAARAESIIVHESEELTVAVPLTETASKWWGRGTRWCTAADEDNSFDLYTEAPLIVMVMADGRKFQLYVSPYRTFLCDEYDDSIEGKMMDEADRELIEPILLWALRQSPNFLRLIPDDMKTREMCQGALDLNGPMAFYHIPFEFIDRQMCEQVARMSGPHSSRIVARIAEAGFLDREMCEALVSRNGTNLERLLDLEILLEGDMDHVDDHVDRDLCLSAVRNLPSILRVVPAELIDREMCMAAVSATDWGWTLRFVPEHLRDVELCQVALNNNGFSEDVPEHLRPLMKAALLKHALGARIRDILSLLGSVSREPFMMEIAVSQPEVSPWNAIDHPGDTVSEDERRERWDATLGELRDDLSDWMERLPEIRVERGLESDRFQVS